MNEPITDLEIVQKEPGIPNVNRMVSLEYLWNIFIKLKGDLSPNTKLEYFCIGRRFCKFMQGRELSPQTMVDWMMFLQNKTFRNKVDSKLSYRLSSGHINSVNVRVKAFLKWMRNMGYLTQDIWSAIPRLKPNAIKDSLMFTEEEYESLKANLSGKKKFQTHLWLIILAYRTGMSLIDCCHLRWRDVHLDDNGPSYIDIYRIKTERHGHKALCTIPIIPFSDLHQWLINLRQCEDLAYPRHDGVTDFVHQEAPAMYAHKNRWRTLRFDFRRIFKYNGIQKGKTFRHFRNSFCSNLVNSGTQIALVCKMTGHNNVTTLLRYLKPDRRALQDGLAKAFNFAALTAGTGKGHDGFLKPE